jgi:uncharacterized repeat protein (TIGR01451 family)
MKKILWVFFALISVNALATCPGMTVTPNFYNASCNASCDGYGYVSVAGGSGNYNYFYQDLSGNSVGNQVNDSIYGLCAGNYRVIVHDITNACFDTTLFSITEPTPITATVIINTQVTCFGGADGSMTVIATGGTGIYTYLWQIGQTGSTVVGVPAGVISVMVMDSNGCSVTVFGTMTQPSQLVATSNSNPATCGLCDGTAWGVASGGTPPYNYQWQPGNMTQQTVTNLCAGSYQFIVVDANGCMTGTGVNVGTNGNVVATATATNSSCSVCTGTVTVLESGGTGPYTYYLDSATFQSNGNFSNVCPGYYNITVEDNNGCQGMATVMVNTNGITGLTVTPIITVESGYGMQDGSIDLTVNGTTGPYTYLWNNGATTEDIYSLSSGSYLVMVTDANGDCQQFNFFVNVIPSYGYITGTLYNDINSNCIYDAGDIAYANQYVTVTNGTNVYYGYTNSLGEYSIWVPSGNYTVTPYSTVNLGSGCTSSYSITVTNGSTIGGNNFAYEFAAVYDVCVSMWSPGIVPGFNGYYYIYVYNSGSMPADGSICMTLPSPLSFVSSMPSGASVSNDTICINYSSLLPNAYYTFTVGFYTPPSLPLGTPMVNWVEATVTNGTDINPSCNQYIYTRPVTGSFDPNDKTASPSGDVFVSEDEFTYLVRFQNTGTGPAVNITITDTLDAMLDPLSFEMLNSSHPYSVEFINGNIIKWRFENIMLPDSGSNEPGSHGHVQFRLKTANTPVVGQDIENTANIYFDFNEPVITNTALNTYVTPGAVEVYEMNDVVIYPNPANERLFIQSKNAGTHTILDVTGKEILQQNIPAMNTSFDIQNLAPGVYFVRSISEKGMTTIKFIKN